MNTVFVGGSRHVSRLPEQVRERLGNIVNEGHRVVVGDANGADKAVQKYLHDAAYGNVTVYCSGARARNNVGGWSTENIRPPKAAKGFDFYAAKDRVMARTADVGFMIWDGKSPGTVLNVLRLIRAGKMAVLMNVPEKTPRVFKTGEHWSAFLASCSNELLSDLRTRATDDEWEAIPAEPDLLDRNAEAVASSEVVEIPAAIEAEPFDMLGAALAVGMVDEALGAVAMLAHALDPAELERDTGLDADSLARMLAAGSGAEFGAVMRILAASGLRLDVRRV